VNELCGFMLLLCHVMKKLNLTVCHFYGFALLLYALASRVIGKLCSLDGRTNRPTELYLHRGSDSCLLKLVSSRRRSEVRKFCFCKRLFLLLFCSALVRRLRLSSQQTSLLICLFPNFFLCSLKYVIILLF